MYLCYKNCGTSVSKHVAVDVINGLSESTYFGWYIDCKNRHGVNNVIFKVMPMCFTPESWKFEWNSDHWKVTSEKLCFCRACLCLLICEISDYIWLGAFSWDYISHQVKLYWGALFPLNQYTWSFLFVRYENQLKDLQYLTVTTLKKTETCVVTPWRLVLLKCISYFTMRIIAAQDKAKHTTCRHLIGHTMLHCNKKLRDM